MYSSETEKLAVSQQNTPNEQWRPELQHQQIKCNNEKYNTNI